MYSFYESTRSKKFGRTSTNMYLQYKWDTENFANHKYRVKTAKPAIDNNAPATFTHMFIRPKKLQLELERYSMIQRNNRFLLERLAKIQREGAWVDTANYSQSRSLNTWKRQQEMIHLAHNNQIMIGRLEDVHAQHNKTQLEDEYLINQKYKANIQKYPPNWRELQEHLKVEKAKIFKNVFDSKYQTEEYHKSRKRALRKWAIETEKHAAAKAEKSAQEAAESEKQEKIAKEDRIKASKERKKALESWFKSSKKWRSARDERLERSKVEAAKQKEQATLDRKMKYRQNQKEEIEARKRGKKEKKKLEQLEKGRNSNEELKKKKEGEERKTKQSTVTNKGAILPAEQTFPDKQALLSEETEKVNLDEETITKGQTTFDKEDEKTQQATSKHKVATLQESISSRASLTEEQAGFIEETPTAKQTTSCQEISPKDMFDEETSISEKTTSDDESFITEENPSDKESLTTDQITSEEEVPTIEESIFDTASLASEQVDSIAETPTTVQTASSQDVLTKESFNGETIDEEAITDDESSIIEENISEKESQNSRPN